jgi:hypothetical protein
MNKNNMYIFFTTFIYILRPLVGTSFKEGISLSEAF